MKNQEHNLALLFLCSFFYILCCGCTKKENIDKVVSSVKENFEKYRSTAASKASDVAHEVETELDALK